MAGRHFWQIMRRATPPRCFLAVAAVLLAVTPSFAGDFDLDEDSTAPAEGVLVMRDRTGTVVSGKISLADEIYTVHGRHGNLQIPASDVRMRCASLQDAYSRLHELTVKHQSANSCMTLARWCLANHLEDEAIEELKAALDLEPDRDDAKRMLQSLTEEAPGIDKSAPRAADNTRNGKTDWPAPRDAVTLGGLSLPNALQFNRKIQPLVVRMCATAGCHTRESEGSFQLIHVTVGKQANRNASEQNLAAILALVDMNAPSSSPLLTVPRGKHGRNGKSVFSGVHGEEQYAELQHWVRDVARDEARRHKPDGSEVARKSGGRQLAANDTAPGGKSGRANDPFAGTPAPAPAFRGEGRTRTMADTSSADPFDPSVFNRKPSGSRR